MRSPVNAVSDLMNELGMYQSVRDTVVHDPENPNRWLITLESVPGSLIRSRLHVEVIQGDPNPYACVLERHNVGYVRMTRIMDKLMRRLERPPRSSQPSELPPSGGSPSPSSGSDTSGPPGGDTTRSEPPHMRM